MAVVIWKALWHTAQHQGSNTTPGLATSVQEAGCVCASGSSDFALFPATQMEQELFKGHLLSLQFSQQGKVNAEQQSFQLLNRLVFSIKAKIWGF